LFDQKSEQLNSEIFRRPKARPQSGFESSQGGSSLRPKDSGKCTCSEIMVIGGQFSTIQIPYICKNLFGIANVDVAADSDQAINFVTDRLSKRCCDRIYKLVLCDYRLEDTRTMCRQI
jgi:hypothetical protein